MNEEETLPKVLNSISSEFSKKDYTVIVVNDGSRDQTGSVAESFQEQGRSPFFIMTETKDWDLRYSEV
jgi:glycosyltransferase involved in cell wall biosynthesis